MSPSDAVTHRRVITLVVISLVAYAVCLVLVGLAAGFDHAATRWLLAAGMAALAVGMGASAAMRLSLFVFDPRSRAWWWIGANWPTRAFRSLSLAIRIVAAIVVLKVGLGILRS